MDLFIFVVYLGGICGYPGKGFWDRFYWPGELGEALVKWAVKNASVDEEEETT